MLAVRNRIQGVKPSPYVGTYWNIYEMKLKE
ncbi:Putative periplasmic component of ABC-type transport system [Planktothrix tepida]|nr:Putative periplasmic component of ABC-type transport system [Planktothrix tepida]